MIKRLFLLALLVNAGTLFAQSSIDVLHYNIHLDVMNFSQKKLKGHTAVRYAFKIPTNTIQLDLLNLTVDSVRNAEGKLSHHYDGTTLTIDLENIGAKDDTGAVTIYYQGQPFTDPSQYGGGFYFTATHAYNVGVGFSANPHNLGRAWFPCIDNFSDRASFAFHIRTEGDKKAFCNGKLDSTTIDGDATKTWHWTLAESIPPYLASVAVAKYATYTDVVNGLSGPKTIAINALKADSAKTVQSFVNLKKWFDNYEARFGPYQWNRIGFNAVPTIGGAMEHATNIAFLAGLADGTKAYEATLAHELAHHWFGDLVTCRTAEDMWLNEGWAVFAEYLFQEDLYGKKAYHDYVNKKHNDVLFKTHVSDSGFYAVSGIPHRITYGSTVYEKGGLVANTLRHYIGDSLFFTAIKSYLTDFKFKDASSADFRDYLQSKTGVDLKAFFDGWVFSPGFPLFSVDSMGKQANGGATDVTLKISQKQFGTKHIWEQNRLPITFLNPNGGSYSTVLIQSGKNSIATAKVPFKPIAALIDQENNVADATSDYYDVIKTTGIKNYSNSYFRMNTKAVTDSARVMVYHHWAPIDTGVMRAGITFGRPSKARYWKIDGDFPATYASQGIFTVNSAIDGDVVNQTNTILIYRESPQKPWRDDIPFTKNLSNVGNDVKGTLTVEELRKGEYAVFAGTRLEDGIHSKDAFKNLVVYPNPTSDILHVQIPEHTSGTLSVLNAIGQEVHKQVISLGTQECIIPRNDLSPGIYTINLYKGTELLGSSKVVWK